MWGGWRIVIVFVLGLGGGGGVSMGGDWGLWLRMDRWLLWLWERLVDDFHVMLIDKRLGIESFHRVESTLW